MVGLKQKCYVGSEGVIVPSYTAHRASFCVLLSFACRIQQKRCSPTLSNVNEAEWPVDNLWTAVRFHGPSNANYRHKTCKSCPAMGPAGGLGNFHHRADRAGAILIVFR